MSTLGILNVQVNDSSSIDVTFTEPLTPNLVAGNISIVSEANGVPSSEVLLVRVSGAMVSITCQPLTPLSTYFIQFKSIPLHPFQSLHGNLLSEDGVSNRHFIIAPLEADNPVKNYLDSFLQGNIYNNQDDRTVISKYIKALAVTLSRALYDIRQVNNENYLSFDVVDEQKIRGTGPFDRLNEEGAYEIFRVARTPSDTSVDKTFVYDIFPTSPISLQRQDNVEKLTPNSVDEAGFFNINSLTLNLSNSPVTKINSIVFTLNTATPVYTYNLERLGYQILNSKYDQNFGFTYLKLKDNQIRISDKILSDPLFAINKIISVEVRYESKHLGVVVDESTINVYTTQSVTREVLPPITNVFNLKYAPITDNSNNIPVLGGVSFVDPNNLTETHSAFKYEIPYRLSALPSAPGQYAIDYATGTVYVYGADLVNDGTGPSPPLASYKYRLTYKSEIDYVYDSSTRDLVALPNGSLVGFDGKVNFKYEEVLIPGVDYEAKLHNESLAERVGNRLVALNAFKTKNGPITNVFRIFNETSGEIYTLNRWSNDKIYFRYNTPPRLLAQTAERASFNTVSNELLFVSTTLTNTSNLNIFKIVLNNNNIVAATEDGLSTSFNSSMTFANGNIFTVEKWFDRTQLEAYNINRLTAAGQYMVDYANGIVYVAVSNPNNFDLGTVTYKNISIVPRFPHVIAVDSIYYQISSLNPKNKEFSYTNFEDGIINPENLDPSDELFLNNNNTAPYQFYNGKVGVFFGSSFVPGVTHEVKFVRGLYEFNDVTNSIAPFNFASVCSSSGFNITSGSVVREVFSTVQYDGTNYYVLINENIPYLSPNITYNFSVIRLSNSQSLWAGNLANVVPGNPVKLILTTNSPASGDAVKITYTISINNYSKVIIDYNKGDYFIDYTYLADEIIVSYEYGDNVLDFRKGKVLSPGEEYFVTYKAGALRDALLKNFGTLVNVPELATFDVDFDRERYRDALTAALTSFIQGPTVTAIKNIGKIISHIEPEIIEAAFRNWSLGSSLLYPESITTTGEFALLPGKFGNGIVMEGPNQTIKFPINSNLRFEEGTFETWIVPHWSGLDNNAKLTFSILKDGYAIAPNEIFIGAAANHPTSNIFTIGKEDNVGGTPNMNRDGVFIYYDKDISGNFYRWYVKVIDGYVGAGSADYQVTINSTGTFYDSKCTVFPKPPNLTIFTGKNSLRFSITAGSGGINEGVTFMSDIEHYVLDFGQEPNKNRLSIYKDVTGYINFRVYDRERVPFSISADVSAWAANEAHHIAASWKLNSRNNRDEMHLFIDGFEVPNIIKYGQKLQPFLHEKFRTVNPEEIVGLSTRDIVGSVDLTTIAGSNVVTSSINFNTYQIFVGDTIYIDEPGFSTAGYIITAINGQSLTLNALMPASLSNGKFSINRTSFTVTSDINVAPNIAVTTIHAMVDGYLSGANLSGTNGSNTITSLTSNFAAAGVLPGHLIRINDSSLEIIYTILSVGTTTLTIDGPLPISFTNKTYQIYTNEEIEIPGTRAIRPSYTISKDGYYNNVLTISNNVYANDLILVRTLGINHRKIRRQYYVWSNNQENVLMTKLPPPISLDEVSIRKVIVSSTAVGPSNSTLSGGVFTSLNVAGSLCSNSQEGRTLTVTIGGNNVDFTIPAQVIITGQCGPYTINETVSFTDYGSIDTSNKFIKVDYVHVVVKPTNSTKTALTFDVKEKYRITYSEGSGEVPVIRFSYHIGGGYGLYSVGTNAVRDDSFLFSNLDNTNYLVIHSPASVAGYYLITGLSADRHTLYVEPTTAATKLPLPSFTNGNYQILNVNDYRSGLQNGYFTFESSKMPSQAYFLSQGFYELEYSTYMSIKIDATNEKAYLGSDFQGRHHLAGIMDQAKIYSVMLTDTRVGESIPSNQRSITKDFNTLKPLSVDVNTLMLVDFDTYPFTNIAKFYVNSNASKEHFQSSVVINETFGNSLVVLDKPLHIPNTGILDTRKEGTIEFWVNPLFDTGNDPVERYYFDAFGAVVEEAVSVTNTSVKISAPAEKILNIKLKNGDPRIDYFAGGKIEIDTQQAIQEQCTNTDLHSVSVSKIILQIISVKVANDFLGIDYFEGGAIGDDGKTILLGKSLPSLGLPLIITYKTTENKNVTLNSQIIRLNRRLPYQNSHVIVTYLPKGIQGDRISIFKDKTGHINFGILASGTSFIVRAPTRWARNTWHRVKASYKFNGGLGVDEMRLFLDGYHYSDVTYGSGMVFGQYPYVFGTSAPGNVPENVDGYGLLENIKFKDPINDLYIGSQYSGESPIFSLIDNFRISNISRPIYAPYGEPIDNNYSSNLSTVIPVTKDLFTTYLSDFTKTMTLNDDFAILKNRETGLFDFSVNILDSFGIVKDNIKSREALEKLIKVLKPANSRVFIQYIR